MAGADGSDNASRRTCGRELRSQAGPPGRFFADSQDHIDPGYDFKTDEHEPSRVRQRDDLYPHEALTRAPTYTGEP